MPNKRFSTYLSDDEATELDLMRVELGLSQKGSQAQQDAQLLAMMKFVTQSTMQSIRDAKRAQIAASSTYGGHVPIATWEDVCERVEFPKTVFRQIIERDPRPQRPATKSTSSAQFPPASEEEEGIATKQAHGSDAENTLAMEGKDAS